LRVRDPPLLKRAFFFLAIQRERCGAVHLSGGRSGNQAVLWIL
jgi:hypothetical protein